MEQHPVPQNVTTFQFRLIGDMTLKQFGYLAGGAILAFISYKLPLPFFFTWPLTVLFGFGGIGFAFIPIEERPMDVWVLSFIKSIYAPTQFVWHRAPPTPEPTVSAAQPQSTSTNLSSKKYVVQIPTLTPPPNTTAATLQGFYAPAPVVVKKSFLDDMFSWIDTLFASKPPKTNVQKIQTSPAVVSSPAPLVQQAPKQEEKPKVVTTEPPKTNPELAALQQKVSSLQSELSGKTQAEVRVLELQKEMADVVRQKREAEEKLVSLNKQSLKQPATQQPLRAAGVVAPPPSGPTVKVIMPESATRAGLPRLTTFPNVVTGIVKDNQGGLLPGVLVTVQDKEGVPLRALKTNKLGQFAASTQLPNGVYVIEIEDPRGRYLFDRAQITLNGTIMPAIEIAAKSKREIDRENLAKQIFGQTPS